MSATSVVGSARKPFYYTLTFQLVLGLAAGGALGLLWPQIGAQLNPLAAAFVKLIKMVAGLIVFLTVVAGFAQVKRGAGVGRLGMISVCYFEVVSTLALLIGLAMGNLFEPGKGLALHADAATALKPAEPLQGVDFVMSIIPKTVVDALAGGIMLQILLVALLFGYALYAMGDKGKPVVDLVNLLTDATFKVVNIILKLAPVGVFGAAAFMLGKYGIGALMPVMKLVGLVYLGCLFLIVVVFSVVAWLTRFSLFGFLKLIREELIIAFTTTSSEAALPGLMKKLESAGCSKATVGFVVPTGYSLNLDGSSIYMTLAALFIAGRRFGAEPGATGRSIDGVSVDLERRSRRDGRRFRHAVRFAVDVSRDTDGGAGADSRRGSLDGYHAYVDQRGRQRRGDHGDFLLAERACGFSGEAA